MSNTLTAETHSIEVIQPKREAAHKAYRRDAARAATRADRAQTDADYNAAIVDLHAANERWTAAQLAYPKRFIEVAV